MGETKTVYLSQLKAVHVLWPGDIQALAEFVLRTYGAKDRIVNSSPSASIRKSRPTLHGLAGYFARIADIPESQINERLAEHGLWLGATVEFDPSQPAASSQRAQRLQD